ncbi:U2 small nuclear ribonucleoprotein auxiliary factor subunit-related protein 1 [Araneus ventricosus]|uniref:U2 small nuclear ribonucleoprotein auxiliary factor subunit-related protein 1 n=1 Tax=Araneus ventricosus TaxID=182803 RepID=A0A4Y2PQX2_ARAVE|nr:U2 small nuclear ribonucleoprotein auxiliary factor subunit-related protein 1 [Araneus ventricosus]
MDSLVSKVVKLTHKQFRALLKKFRRKKKQQERQQFAKEREKQELLEQQRRESSPNYKEREEERRRNSQLYEEFEEREGLRKHKFWLLREEQAQKEFRKKQEQLEQEKIKREEERKRIVAEFEKQQFLESKKEDENQKLKTQKEEALQEALSSLSESNGPWHNPIAPEHYNAGTEREQCQFFVKTGCCRFGERCSRGHAYPSVSTTILIKGMYSHFSIGHSERDDFDTDNVLEYEDKERYEDFRNFYNDVLPEFKLCGKVIQFKVCSNHEPHLRGNVYVQFSKEEEAVKAYQQFNGRYYAGKQLTCEFTNVIKWRSAICGLYFRKLCPKGLNCNFLHVFKNPTDEFWDADRDLPSRENAQDSRSSRSNHSRRRSERKSSHRSYSSESQYHYRDNTPDRRNDYSYHYRSTDSDDDVTDNGHYSSSRRKHSDRRKDSSHRSHHKRKYRDSRSRSRSLSPLSDDHSKSSRGRKKSKHKKKSKKRKRESSYSGNEES